MAPHSSTLAWIIPWMEEPGRLQSMGSLRVGPTERLHFPFSLSCIGEGNGNPLQCSCLENPRDEGAWWAAVYGVAQSRTRLKRFSSSIKGVYKQTVCICKIKDNTLDHDDLRGITSKKARHFQSHSCIQLCGPMDCNLPGSSVHGIFQAKVLNQVVISYSRGSSLPRD